MPDLSITGTPSWPTVNFGQSYDPNGGKLSYSGAAVGPGGAAYTVEAWVNHTGSAGTTRIAGVIGATNANWVRFGLMSTGKAYFSSGTVDYNTGATTMGTGWHHLAVSHTATAGGTAFFFVDGILQTSIVGNSGSASWASMTLGRTPTDTSQWIGQIDEVRVSSTARYTAAFTPPTAPFALDSSTVALYHLDGNPADANSSALFRLGGNVATAARLGSATVSAIYQGSTQVL